MMKEILINFILVPTIDSITEPEYVNQTISWLCEDAALNNEAFLAVVKATDNVEELEAVKAKVGYDNLITTDAQNDMNTLTKHGK